MDTIGAIFKFLTESMCFWRQKDAQKNTPAMVTGKQVTNEQAFVDKSTKAIAEHDVKEIRNELAN